MYIRISFDDGQKISLDELKAVQNTLSDEVSFTQLYKKEDGSIEALHTWCETDNPNDPKLKSEERKYALVYKADWVSLNSNKEYITDIELFLQKHPNLKIKLRGTPKTIEKDYTSYIEQIVAVQEKFENALKQFNRQVEFNQKCEVHIANMGLMHINQLGYSVDTCTEALQDILNKGWRIIACCVQPDGRRPDYIMGRYNPSEDAPECVKF
jgi:hypothetical protein